MATALVAVRCCCGSVAHCHCDGVAAEQELAFSVWTVFLGLLLDSLDERLSRSPFGERAATAESMDPGRCSKHGQPPILWRHSNGWVHLLGLGLNNSPPPGLEAVAGRGRRGNNDCFGQHSLRPRSILSMRHRRPRIRGGRVASTAGSFTVMHCSISKKLKTIYL